MSTEISWLPCILVGVILPDNNRELSWVSNGIATSRHQSAREETGENKNHTKNVMFDSQDQDYCQEKPQGLKKK